MLTKRKGFTVVEMLVVLLFIGVIAAMTINITTRNRGRWALRNTAREITSIFYQAKQLASRENTPVLVDFDTTEFILYSRRAGAWERVRGELYDKKIAVSKTPIDSTGFAIAPSGYIIKPGTPETPAIYTTQIIVLSTPHGYDFDTMTITIYPYGGLRVQKDFK
jgi:prepilin-type N-terminal cleavage/methylation domain-containing protein